MQDLSQSLSGISWHIMKEPRGVHNAGLLRRKLVPCFVGLCNLPMGPDQSFPALPARKFYLDVMKPSTYLLDSGILGFGLISSLSYLRGNCMSYLRGNCMSYLRGNCMSYLRGNCMSYLRGNCMSYLRGNCMSYLRGNCMSYLRGNCNHDLQLAPLLTILLHKELPNTPYLLV